MASGCATPTAAAFRRGSSGWGRRWPRRGRGEDDLVGSLTEQMMRWAAPRRVGAVQMFAEHARGLSAPGRSAFEEAYRHFSAISPPGALPVYKA